MDDRIRRFWCARGQTRQTVVVVVDYTVQQTKPNLFSGAMGSTLRLTDNFCTFFLQWFGSGQNKTANYYHFSLPNIVAKIEFCYTDCRRNLHMILMDCTLAFYLSSSGIGGGGISWPRLG